MKKNAKPVSAAAIDILLVPALVFCERLSGFMIAQNSVCEWTRYGILCGTCGGTRMVNSILHGEFIKAFNLNQFLFLCTIYLAVSLIVLNLAWVFNVGFAKKMIRKMYNLAAVITVLVLFVLFIAIRNIPFIIRLVELFKNQIV